jgi:hypothetical protein
MFRRCLEKKEEVQAQKKGKKNTRFLKEGRKATRMKVQLKSQRRKAGD